MLEYDAAPFQRATYINQARVHMGYHYPRSLTTAVKSAGYFRRFVEDFGFCIHDRFEQIYATSDQFSWTNAKQFMEFCRAADIKCEEVAASKYFKPGMCDGAFLTEEYTYDAKILQKFYEDELVQNPNVEMRFGARIERIVRNDKVFTVQLRDGSYFEAPFVLNATYASVNQMIDRVEGIDKELFDIKYELCEIILCEPSANLKNTGITVMDGPFFSIMPFGLDGTYSLSAVHYTPHKTSFETLPNFDCMEKNEFCNSKVLNNCNLCKFRPKSSFDEMLNLCNLYLKNPIGFETHQSAFAIKPILKRAEGDDARPTLVEKLIEHPRFISVLSGKIDIVYDLDQILGEI